MNSTLELLNRRRSVRAYIDSPITAEEREAILQGAFRAPTAGAMQLYTIIEVADQALKDRLVETCDHQPFIAKAPLVLVDNASSPYKDLASLLAAAKAQPKSINYATCGSGSAPHLVGALLEQATGVRLQDVPYRGSAPALTELIGGQSAQVMFDNMPSAIAHVRSGALRALAVTSAARSPAAPELPTMREAGLADFDVQGWFGLFAPASLPDADARRYANAFSAAMHSPAGKEKFKKMGITPEELTLDGFAQFVRSENSKYEFLIRAAKIKID